MPVKIFEKHGLIGIGLLFTSALIFWNTNLFSAPVRVSEKGLLIDLLAVVLLYAAIRFISRSMHRL